MKREASSGHWKKYDVQTIHNPVPDEYFKKVDRRSAQGALGLASSKPVILAIAGNLEEERKGGSVLEDILHHLSDDDIQFLLIGHGLPSYKIPSNAKLLGFV